MKTKMVVAEETEFPHVGSRENTMELSWEAWFWREREKQSEREENRGKEMEMFVNVESVVKENEEVKTDRVCGGEEWGL